MIYLLLFIAIISLVIYNFQEPTGLDTLSINQVASDIQAGKIERIEVNENELNITYADGTQRKAHMSSGATLVEQLKDLGVMTEALQPEKIKLEVIPPSAWLSVATIFGYILPFIILAAVFWFIFRQAQGSNNAAHVLWKIPRTNVYG